MPISFVNLMQPDYTPFMGMTTRHKAAAQGIEMPKIHGVNKGLDPHVKPEHQKKVVVSEKVQKRVRFAPPKHHQPLHNEKGVDKTQSILQQNGITHVENLGPCQISPQETQLPPIPSFVLGSSLPKIPLDPHPLHIILHTYPLPCNQHHHPVSQKQSMR